jgi:2-hydroxycyclohexanecarboxyl-CoA dehydrogenase
MTPNSPRGWMNPTSIPNPQLPWGSMSPAPNPAATAAITGAAQGIGRAIALRLAAGGIPVAALDLDQAGALRTAEEIQAQGGQSAGFAVDVSHSGHVSQAIAAAEAALGPIGILVNVAGIYNRPSSVRDLDLATWQRILAVNLTGVFLCTRAVLPGMLERRWGRIVSIASGQALRGRGGVSPYAASKAGLIGFTKAVALEVAANGITVNAVMPAVTDTAMPRYYGSEERLLERGKANPIGRIGQPEDIAAAVAFLVSPDAVYITGQTLPVNGGAIMLP